MKQNGFHSKRKPNTKPRKIPKKIDLFEKQLSQGRDLLNSGSHFTGLIVVGSQ